jgi:hypothetical protein
MDARPGAGSQSGQALELLTNQATFLDPLSSEISPTPAPNPDSLHRMIAATDNFVVQTLQCFPNEFATRSIARQMTDR